MPGGQYLDVLLRQGIQESGWHAGIQPPIAHAHAGVGEIEQLLGAGDADIEKAALLLNLAWIVVLVLDRPRDWKQALLDPGNEDDRVLKTLGRVQRDQSNKCCPASIYIIKLRHQGRFVQI